MMAVGGNKRGSKRPSSSTSSYTSTITTVIFIALCVLGVWMLTTNSIGPPQTKLLGDKKDQTTTTTTEFEDNPGYLPTDAIQPDDPKKNDNADGAAAVVAAAAAGGGGDSKNEEARVAEEVGLQGQDSKESAEEQEKQKEGQTQISEESTLTQNQQKQDDEQNQQTITSSEISQNQEEQQQEEQKQVAETNQSQNEKTNEKIIEQQQDDSGNQAAETSGDQISEEDKQQRIEPPKQQQQNVQFPDETNIEPKEPQSEEAAMQTATVTTTENLQQSSSSVAESQEERQTTTTTEEEPDTSKAVHQNQTETRPKTKRERKKEHKPATSGTDEPVPATTESKSGIPKESTESKKSWSTQAKQSANEKERREDESKGKESIYGYTWHLCNESSGPDFIPCLDNEKALRKLSSTRHYEHRERHCPEEGPTCLVPLPEGYKKPIKWPHSRDKIWYRNVPHKMLADVKGHQNWVKVTGEFLTFPGGGTQFIHGALHYIDVIQEVVPEIAWGKNTRVVLDVGCGVASFGGYLFERDVLTMSFAPKDEHEAQVQFALERGIPAISAVMGTQRLPFPGNFKSLIFFTVLAAGCLGTLKVVCFFWN